MMRRTKTERLISRFFFWALFAVFSVSTSAQIVNVQPLMRKENPDGFTLHVKGAFEWTTGSTQLLKVNLGLAGRYISGKHLVLGIADGGYAEESANRFISKTFEHLRYRYRFMKWFGMEAFTQYQYDEFRRIDLRFLGGLGPRFVPFSNDILEISIGSAYMYEFNRNAAGSYPDSSQENYYHRWSNYMNIDLDIAKNLSFFATVYIQPDLQDFSNYRLLNENTLTIKINSWFSIALHGTITYDSRPLYGVAPLNTSLFSAFQINLDTAKDKKSEKPS